MKDGSWTLTGWPAVPVILTLVATQVLTALAMSIPVAWLVRHLFAPEAVRALFGEHFGYWHAVGLFALWYAARFKVKFQGPSKYRSADH